MKKFPFKLPLILDAGTGTNLIEAGLPAGVCVEKWIIENPQALKKLQRECVQAGSDVVYAPTFGANRAKLEAYGLQEKVVEINKKLVEISRDAVGADVLVGGDIAPTGLFIEPYGDATARQIMDIYTQQAFALKDAGVDFIVFETMMSLWELRLGVLAARETGLPIFCTITLESSGRTLMGTSFLSCLITLQALGVSAVGINCSEGPESLAEIISSAYPYAEVPLIAKPNGGKPDPNDNTKFDLTAEQFADKMKDIVEAGADIVGGCCGTNAKHIGLLKEVLINTQRRTHSEIDTRAACTEKETFFLLDDENLILSEPIDCDYGLEDDLIALEDERVNVAVVRLNNEDDPAILSETASMTQLPIAMLTNSAEILEDALLNYHGRALIDAESEIDEEILKKLAEKYGAIIL